MKTFKVKIEVEFEFQSNADEVGGAQFHALQFLRDHLLDFDNEMIETVPVKINHIEINR